MLRSLVLLIAALCLSGCGMVSSDRPLFGPADAAGAPTLKPGLWALVEPGCRFNVRSPAAKWPDCAHAIDLHDGVATNAKAEDEGRFAGVSAYQVAAGDPAVLQAQGPKDGSSRGAYVYFGLRPLAADEAGLILRTRVWPVMCAPPAGVAPPPAPARAKGKGKAKSKPTSSGLLPGMVGGKSPQSNCLAAAPGPVRNAARLSEGWAFAGTKDDTGREVYWIRDRDR